VQDPTTLPHYTCEYLQEAVAIVVVTIDVAAFIAGC